MIHRCRKKLEAVAVEAEAVEMAIASGVGLEAREQNLAAAGHQEFAVVREPDPAPVLESGHAPVPATGQRH